MLDCVEMRRDILRMGLGAKSAGAHFGGSFSLVEVVAALYGGVMTFDLTDLWAETRDRLVFSKGHGVMPVYAAFRQLGLISAEELLTYKATGSDITAHPTVCPRLGTEFASGSLGQGLSLGVGTCLALRRKGNLTSRTFVILGDGECNEGSVWEAVESAAHYRLANLVAIVDQNGLQYDGDTSAVMSMSDLADKWRAFGWECMECDGHDVAALSSSLSAKSDRPLCVIAKTIKGKGVSFMEGVASWHHGVLTQKLFDQAMAELSGGAHD